jgi:hypothetical protein
MSFSNEETGSQDQHGGLHEFFRSAHVRLEASLLGADVITHPGEKG